MPEEDPFKAYYAETYGAAETPLPRETKKEAVIADANIIRASINIFIKNLNTCIGEVFTGEKEKGTRQDLIVTLVLGGLAFTVANVFYLITKSMGQKMSATEYEATFMGMYRSAMRDIGKDKK